MDVRWNRGLLCSTPHQTHKCMHTVLVKSHEPTVRPNPALEFTKLTSKIAVLCIRALAELFFCEDLQLQAFLFCLCQMGLMLPDIQYICSQSLGRHVSWRREKGFSHSTAAAAGLDSTTPLSQCKSAIIRALISWEMKWVSESRESENADGKKKHTKWSHDLDFCQSSVMLLHIPVSSDRHAEKVTTSWMTYLVKTFKSTFKRENFI